MPYCFFALVLLLAVSPAMAAETAPASPRVWRAGVESLSNPYTFADSHGHPAGFAVGLLQAVAEAQGLQVEYVVMDWADLLTAFKSGGIDIICDVADTAGRREYMQFSTTILLTQGTLFQRRDVPPVTTTAGLSGHRLALPPSSRAHEFVRNKDWGLQLVFAASLTECVRAVHEGRADLLLASSLVTAQVVKSSGNDDIMPSQLQFPDFDYRLHFGVHRDQADLLEALNEGLATVHKNGTYDRLYEQWLGQLEPRRLRWSDAQPYLLPVTILALAALGGLLWQRRLLRRLSRQARAIRENEERLRLVFEGSQDGFWDWEAAAGRILRSPRWAGMLGYAPDEIPPTRDSFFALVHPDDQPLVWANEKQIMAGKDHFAHEFRLRAKSGEWKWILDRGKVVARDPVTGAPSRITGTHTDITARKLADEEADKLQHMMQEAQKLESLGVLAGGIAHDFNNLLTVILGNTSLARLEAGDATANVPRLDSVITSANRAAELCRQLLAYAGKGSYTIERLNLNDLITETTRLLEVSISRQARLEFALAPSLPRIEADASQIQQVIMNLVINASEAVAGNPGTIRLATTVVTLPQVGVADSASPSEVAPGNFVCVEIADTGCGMTPEVLARIFDPFFTTKFTGRGLGLAAVTGIVRTHGGTLKVQSTPGQGSTFRLYLPVSQKQTADPFTMPPGEPPRT